MVRHIAQKYGLLACVLLTVFLASYFGVSKSVEEEVSAPAVIRDTLYPVKQVIDGDTLVILKEEQEETVRLIGIDTPEKAGPYTTQECFGTEATTEATRILEGKNVRLEGDDTQNIRDTYGRLLAYVFLEDGTFINKHMLEAGYAHEYTFRGVAYQYQKEFRKAEETARTHMRGLWGPDACITDPL